MCIRDRRSGESLQEFEANVYRLTRLAYPEKSEDFRMWISLIMCIDGTRDSQLHVLRIARHDNKSDALVHALRFEATKSATYINPVSYTHLDVYKRQAPICRPIRTKNRCE